MSSALIESLPLGFRFRPIDNGRHQSLPQAQNQQPSFRSSGHPRGRRLQVGALGFASVYMSFCRLFRKPDEKVDNSKYDEVESTGLSPTMVKSSPDDTSLYLFQEPSLLDMEVGKQPEGIKRWMTDKSDEMTSNIYLHVESCMSDVDRLSGAVAAEIYPSQ